MEGQVLSGLKLARAVLVMVTFLSWVANVRTSVFTVRIPVWNRSGLTLRSVGSSGILLPVPFLRQVQKWCVAYRRVRRVHLLLLRRVLEVVHFGVWLLLGVLCIWRVLALLVFHLMYTGLGLRRCAYRQTRPVVGGRWGAFYSRGAVWFAQYCAFCCFQGNGMVPYMLALLGQPSLHGYYACMVCWAKGAFWRNCRPIFM